MARSEDTHISAAESGTKPSNGAKMASCHPDKKHYAKGLCVNCYQREKQREKRGTSAEIQNVMEIRPLSASAPTDIDKEPNPIKYRDPQVAKYVVAVLFKHAMDWRSAIAEIAPESSAAKRAEIAAELANAKEIVSLIEEEFSKRGLDDNSRDEFVKTMWKWLYQGGTEEKLKAATILGKGFVGEKVEVNKPQELPIKDYKSGIDRMMGTTPTSPATEDISELN